MKSTDDETRFYAIQGLTLTSRISGNEELSNKVQTAIISALHDKSAKVRRLAVQYLGCLSDLSLIPLLEKVVEMTQTKNYENKRKKR